MKTVNFLMLLPFLITALFVSPAFGSDWVKYGKTNLGVHSYNKARMKHRTKDIIQVWNRVVFSSDEGRGNYIQIISKQGLSTEGYENLSHYLNLHEIDCKKGMYRLLSMTDYDTDGNVLFSETSDKSTWDYILPASIMDSLRKEVCK
jgi:hypothetical protein